MIDRLFDGLDWLVDRWYRWVSVVVVLCLLFFGFIAWAYENDRKACESRGGEYVRTGYHYVWVSNGKGGGHMQMTPDYDCLGADAR